MSNDINTIELDELKIDILDHLQHYKTFSLDGWARIPVIRAKFPADKTHANPEGIDVCAWREWLNGFGATCDQSDPLSISALA